MQDTLARGHTRPDGMWAPKACNLANSTSVKTKKYWTIINIKMENNELKKDGIKNCGLYYSSDVIKVERISF